MKTKLTILLFFTALIVGCRSKSYNKEAQGSLNYKTESAVMLDEQSPPPPPPPSESNLDKKIIKTAYINIEVVNLNLSRKQIDSSIKEFKGYIVNENLQNTDYQLSSNINIKVPAINFDKMLAKLASMAQKVEYQNIETQDVTEEYIDVETRLSNGRKVEQSYIKLLQRARTIEDILKIEQKLGEIRTEIESTQGRLKYLNNQVSYSTINLNIHQTLEYKFIAEKLPNFWERLKSSIVMGWRGIVVFILFLIKLWPLWILVVLGWFGWKRFNKSKKRKRKDEKKERKLEKKQKKDTKESELAQ